MVSDNTKMLYPLHSNNYCISNINIYIHNIYRTNRFRIYYLNIDYSRKIIKLLIFRYDIRLGSLFCNVESKTLALLVIIYLNIAFI